MGIKRMLLTMSRSKNAACQCILILFGAYVYLSFWGISIWELVAHLLCGPPPLCLQKKLNCSVAHISFSAHSDYDQTSGFLDQVSHMHPLCSLQLQATVDQVSRMHPLCSPASKPPWTRSATCILCALTPARKPPWTRSATCIHCALTPASKPPWTR